MPRRKRQIQVFHVFPIIPISTISDDVYDLYNDAYMVDRKFNADSIRRFVSVVGRIKYSLLVQLVQIFYLQPLNGDILRRMLQRDVYSLTPRLVFERHPEYRVEDDPKNSKDFFIIKIN